MFAMGPLAVVLAALGGWREREARTREAGLEWLAGDRLYRSVPREHGADADGFHDEAPRGGRTLLVLGDSMTWGTGTAAEAWPAVLEKDLGSDWDVRNRAVYGYDPRQQGATLAQSWDLEPAAILVGLYWNDAIPTRVVQIGDPPSPIWLEDRGALWFHSALWREQQGRHAVRGYAAKPEAGFVETQLRAMKQAADSHGVPLGAVLLWPHALAEGIAACARLSQLALDCALARDTTHQVAREAQAAGVEVFDTQSYMVEAAFPANRGDWEHPSPAGAARIGHGLAEPVRTWLAQVQSGR
jgi:lysophospholipase L1-like esterase